MRVESVTRSWFMRTKGVDTRGSLGYLLKVIVNSSGSALCVMQRPTHFS